MKVMTIKVRNTIFITCLIISSVAFLLFLAGVLYLLYICNSSFQELIDPTSPLFSLTQITFYLLFALISGIILLYSFRNTSSPEIFFLMLFMLVFSLEGLQAGLIYIQEANLPFEIGRTLSRGIYFGRYLGTISLFVSGLFACGIRYQRMEILIGLAILISFSLAASIPLDNRTADETLLYTNSLNREFLIGFFIIKIMTIWNYVYASIIHKNNNYFIISLGVLLILAGRELAFMTSIPAFTSLALLLLILGTTIFVTRMHKMYLWF